MRSQAFEGYTWQAYEKMRESDEKLLKDRLIYRFDDDSIYIFTLGGDYDWL